MSLRQSGLPRRYAPRNDGGVSRRRYAPRNDGGARQAVPRRRYALRCEGGALQAVSRRRCAPRSDGVKSPCRYFSLHANRHCEPRSGAAIQGTVLLGPAHGLPRAVGPRNDGGARQAVPRRDYALRNDGMARPPVGAACGREQTPPAPSTPSFALAERSYPSTTASSPNGLLIPTVSLVKESP